ncbi:MAG: hypothetical protein AB7T08_05505 [Hyphomonadaceae bacterium]
MIQFLRRCQLRELRKRREGEVNSGSRPRGARFVSVVVFVLIVVVLAGSILAFGGHSNRTQAPPLSCLLNPQLRCFDYRTDYNVQVISHPPAYCLRESGNAASVRVALVDAVVRLGGVCQLSDPILLLHVVGEGPSVLDSMNVHRLAEFAVELERSGAEDVRMMYVSGGSIGSLSLSPRPYFVLLSNGQAIAAGCIVRRRGSPRVMECARFALVGR